MTATPRAPRSPDAASTPVAVHRVEVWPRRGEPDPPAEAVLRDAARELGSVLSVHAGRVYLIEAPLEQEQCREIAHSLLSDPISQEPIIGAEPATAPGHTIEVHYQPGVMDPVAQSTREAILEMLPHLADSPLEVRTGFRYDLRRAEDSEPFPPRALERFAQRHLANTVIQDIHFEPFHPDRFPHTSPYTLGLSHVPIIELDDEGLMKLSRQGHLFLSLEEMRAIQSYYRNLPQGAREPTDIELETIAQTWSEHCVHKTLKSTVHYRDQQASPGAADFASRPGHRLLDDGTLVIDNLLKSTIAAATRTLMSETELGRWCISVFEDNAGIVRFDDEYGVCIKVETHNHPSAIEPYGGAATGIGGCIRDIMGTGLFAWPVANTDVFCVADPRTDADALPRGVIHPHRILEQVVAGVRDYGNRMGIPTVQGAVWFHDDYLANPLVFAGCIGLIPLDRCFGEAQEGDRIVALGGATGRDGIHGATFSSAELTDTHADEFGHAVQIGNAITQKKVMDVLRQARDHRDGEGDRPRCLFHAITDCGAGGFSSAVGEMGRKVGARVELERAPLKYQGLSYDEIWISEAQERMVLAVPERDIPTLRKLCEAEDVSMCILGQYGVRDEAGRPELVLRYEGSEVGRLSMDFLHDGIPMPRREARWAPPADKRPEREIDIRPRSASGAPIPLDRTLLRLLSHPNIASKHWIIRQYDHEVQGGSVVKPLAGPGQDGPSDGAVVRPRLDSERAIALAGGLQTGLSEKTPGGDSYWMSLAAIDEAVRNLVCIGADPARICLLDNFCWPGCDRPEQLGALVRAAEGCYDGAMAYRTPFVSGKDSLNNQFTTESGRVITIPPTLLITAMGMVEDVRSCMSMDGKQAGHVLLVVGLTRGQMGGSHLHMIEPAAAAIDPAIPRVDLAAGPATAAAVASLIRGGHIRAAHDCSDGGLLVAAAEMAFAGGIGLELDLAAMPCQGVQQDHQRAFAETPSRYLLEVEPARLEAVSERLRQADIAFARIGRFVDGGRLIARGGSGATVVDLPLDELRSAWLSPLDF